MLLTSLFKYFVNISSFWSFNCFIFTESRRCMCDKIKSDMDCGTESKSYPTVTDEWIDNNTLSRPDA